MGNLQDRIGWAMLGIILFVFSACKRDQPDSVFSVTPWNYTVPVGFPALEFPADNPWTVEGVRLGRFLYFDDVLSRNGKSCNSCHNQSKAFSEDFIGPTGHSIPAHLNLAWKPRFGWYADPMHLD